MAAMPLRTSSAALLLAGLALSSGMGRAPVPPGEMHPTQTGPVWVEMVFTGADLPQEGIGRGVIEAAPERVWRALTDYTHWQEFMPFLERSDALPQPDGSVLGNHSMNLPIGQLRYQVRFTQQVATGAEGRVWQIRWTYVAGSGNVTDLRGSWTLTAKGTASSFAVCRLYIEPGGATPRSAFDRGTSKMLPWIFHGLRQHVRRSRYDEP
jgi:ribosome-associated toxin RatA of RatAB toxin-antitoxin module